MPRGAEAAPEGKSTPPRVNVILNTYNHAPYLRQAIEGVLAQTGVSFDITIIDDVSTDGTDKIIEEFASAHPELIRVSCPPVNLYSSAELRRAVNRAEGEFVALMDGDDYWTDPEKLRKQVDFLDENPDLSMCFHDCIVVDESGQLVRNSFFETGPPPTFGAYRHIARANYVPGPSPLIRRRVLAPLPGWIDPCDWTDWALHLLAAENGPIGFMPDVMAAYRRHAGGHWTGMAVEQRFATTVAFLTDFGRHLAPDRARELDRGISSAWVSACLGLVRARNVRGVARSMRTLTAVAVGRRRLALIGRAFCYLCQRLYRQLR